MADSVIQDIKHSLPGIFETCQVLKKESAKSYAGPCPKCGGHDRFIYKTDSGKCWCRQCHEKPMDVIDFHCWLSGIEIPELIKKYRPELYIHRTSQKLNGASKDIISIWENIFCHTNTDALFSFLHGKRKISKKTIEKAYDTGFVRFKKHAGKSSAVFPYKPLQGDNVFALQAISVDQKPFPFTLKNGSPANKVFIKGSKPAQQVFFKCGNDITASKIIIISEAVINALTASECFPDACCLALGGSTHTKKVKALKPYLNDIQKVVVCVDNDAASEKMLRKISKILGDKVYSFCWNEDDPKGYDINDLFQAGQKARVISLIRNAEQVYFKPEVKTGLLIDPETQAKIYLENEAKLAAINKKHAAIMVGGKFYILNEYIDPATKKPDISFSSAFDFKNRYANKYLASPENSTGRGQPIAEAWLKYEDRREYDGVIFDPNSDSPQYYNLWHGLSYAPKKGDWSLFEGHILNVICGGDSKLHEWVLAWMSRIVKDPGGKRPGTAIVLRGKQGTGKGVFVNIFGQLFGKHFLQIAQSSQVVGRFNHHLKDGLLVFVDEGFWAGDKQAEGVIKNMITEPYVNIEQKGKDIIRVKNHINLIIASNNSWVIPAGLEERRFFVLDVSDKHQQDHKHFAAIADQMENGGLEAMLYDLLEWDFAEVDLRTFEQTAGLFEQKLYSMDTVQKYWFERLKEGNLRPYQPGRIGKYGDTNSVDWEQEILASDQYEDYREFADSLNIRHILARVPFGMALKKLCSGIKTSRQRLPGEGTRVYFRQFPPLEECRAEFDRLLKMKIPWEEGDES